MKNFVYFVFLISLNFYKKIKLEKKLENIFYKSK